MQNTKNGLTVRPSQTIAALLLCAALAACGEQERRQALPPVEVGAVQVQANGSTLSLEQAAQLRGVREVEVRARVSGILLKRLYQEGSRVKANDLLFRSIPRRFRRRWRAPARKWACSRRTCSRPRAIATASWSCIEQKLVSVRDRDNAIAAYESATRRRGGAGCAAHGGAGSFVHGRARADRGLTSREVRSEGSLVTAGTRFEPAHAHRAGGQALRGVRNACSGSGEPARGTATRGTARKVSVRVTDIQGKVLADNARIEFIAPVGRQTRPARWMCARFSTTRARRCCPGRWCVRTWKASARGLARHSEARRDARHAGLVRVGHRRRQQGGGAAPGGAGQTSGNNVVVTSGLKAGDRVVVDGVLKVQPGARREGIAAVERRHAAAAGGAAGRGHRVQVSCLRRAPVISNFFIDRPLFAMVVSAFIVIAGLAAFTALPVSMYPDIAPPSVGVNTAYPGASADVIAETVAAPLEQALNGVEGMLYMRSANSSSGAMQLTITFAVGTDPDISVINVQNRVQSALPLLPEEVRRQGVTVAKSLPSFLQVVTLDAPDGRYDELFVSNYATVNVLDELRRIPGVGDLQIFGARDYSIRIWLKPDRLSEFGLTPADVAAAVREQNTQSAAGRLGDEPMVKRVDLTLSVTTQGRLADPEQFERIVLKTGPQGQIVRLRDVARVELGARDYTFGMSRRRAAGGGCGYGAGASRERAPGVEGRARQDDRARREIPGGAHVGHSVRHQQVRADLDARSGDHVRRGDGARVRRGVAIPL